MLKEIYNKMNTEYEKTSKVQRVAGGVAVALLSASSVVACNGVEGINPVIPPTPDTNDQTTEPIETRVALASPTETTTEMAESYKIIEQDEVLRTALRQNLFEIFKKDEGIRAPFPKNDEIAYEATAVRVMYSDGVEKDFIFLSASSETTGVVAMVVSHPQTGIEVYAPLNRIVDKKDETIALGITHNPFTGEVLEDFIIVLDTGLSGKQISELSIEEINELEVSLVPANVNLPADFIIGKKGLASPVQFLPTATPTPEPTPEPTPTPVSYTPEQIEQMTDQEKLSLAPEVDGLNEEFYRGFQIIYRNNEGVVKQIYKLDTKEMIEIPEGYIFFDVVNQFTDIKVFKEYSSEHAVSSTKTLGIVKEGQYLEAALDLPEGYLWDSKNFDKYVAVVGKDSNYAILFVSEAQRFSVNNIDFGWGDWSDAIKIAFLTSTTGEAEKYIYYP